ALVEEAFSVGVRGYMTKETATRNVVEAVTEIHAGHYYLSPAIAHYVIAKEPLRKERLREHALALVALTRQERKVLQLISEGGSTKEVAALLKVSANTVHVHRNRIMAKLNIHRQAGLVHYAVKAGIAKL